MTSLPTPPKRRLTYNVSLLRREDWSVACTTDGLDKALTEARSALATGRYQRVKVEQSFTDSSSNRAVATVIFDERGPAGPGGQGDRYPHAVDDLGAAGHRDVLRRTIPDPDIFRLNLLAGTSLLLI